MYKNAVRYTFKGEIIWLAPNSEAYRLFQELKTSKGQDKEKKIKELDKLLESCDNEYRKWSK